MFEVAGSMFGVAAVWAAMYLVLVGWGQFWPLYASGGLSNTRMWMGLVMSIAFLQIWHLILPVDWRATTVVASVGIAGCVWRLRRTRNDRGELRATLLKNRFFAALAVPILLWIANHCLRAPSWYDSGLYHFQSIRWLNEYSIVPGLGNLYGRLAFNQSYFLYPAVLNAAPYFQKGYYFANGFLLTALALQLLYRAIAGAGLPLKVFSAFMLVILLRRVEVDGGLTSPTPDLAVFVLGTLLMLWLLECMIEARTSSENLPACVACLAWVAATGSVFKLNFLAFAIVVTLVGLWLLMRVTSGPRNSFARVVIVTMLLMGGLVGVWMARGVVTSGYPLYPSTLGGVAVDWKIPKAEVQLMHATIVSFGRTGIGRWVQTPITEGWFKPWLAWMVKQEVRNCLVMIAVTSLALVTMRLCRPIKYGRELWLPLLPPVAWLVFWFFTAPEPRFARAPFWLIPGWLSAVAVTHMANAFGWKDIFIMRALLVLGVLAIVPSSVMKGKLVTSGGFGEMPCARLEEYSTDSGLKVFVPCPEELAWDAPLPATPYPDAAVTLRRKTLADGFRIAKRSDQVTQDAAKQ